MKKVLIFLCSVLFALVATAFFVVLNLKISISSAAKVENIAAQSNFYDISALYIKNEIVNNSKIALNEGTNFEKINSAVTAETVKPTVDTAIESILAAINNKSAEKVIPINFATPEYDGTTFVFSKKVNLNDNRGLIILQNTNLLLVVLLLISAVLAAFRLLLAGKSSGRMRQLGALCGYLLVSLSIFWVGVNQFLVNRVTSLISRSNFVVEAKLVQGLTKLFQNIITSQAVSYWIEIALALVFCVLFLSLSQVGKKEDLGKIDTRI